MTITIQDLFDIQGSDQTTTPTELLDQLREYGRRVTKRTLGFWQESGLLPAALRVGARGGVYPQSVVDLAVFVADLKERGASLDVIGELLPIWRHLAAAQADGHVDIAAFERHARSANLSREANTQIPFLVEHATLGLCDNCLAAVQWEMKDGNIVDGASGLKLRFAIGQVSSDDGLGDLIAWTQLTLPGLGDIPDIDDPALVVLGLPNGIELRRPCCDSTDLGRRTRPRRSDCRVRTARVRRSRASQKEVLPLTISP